MVEMMGEMQATEPIGDSKDTNCDNRTIISIPLSDDQQIQSSSTTSDQNSNTDTGLKQTELQIAAKQLIKKSLKLDLEPTCFEMVTGDSESVRSDDPEEEDDDLLVKSPKSPKSGEWIY